MVVRQVRRRWAGVGLLMAIMGGGGTPAAAQQRPGPDAISVAGGMLVGLATLPATVLAGALSAPRHWAEAAGDDRVDAGSLCPLVSRPVYDVAGRFVGYRTFPHC